VGAYRSLREEIQTDTLWDLCLAAGFTLYFPRVVDLKSRRMGWIPFRGAGSIDDGPWTKGAHGIPELQGPAADIHAASFRLLFVPGVAFTPQGARLGMGAGYYDRLNLEGGAALSVGLAFDFQVIDSIPQDGWDRPVDWVVTDQREIRACRADALP
jgi:5-formyltetrahydrofolate cyclo-ligase